MSVYRVMVPAPDRPAEPRFIAERFRWLAFLFPFFWLLFQRQWLTAVLVVALTLLLGVALPYLGFPAWYTTLCSLGIGVFIAFESAGVIASGLSKRGYEEAGVVKARDELEADYRWSLGAGAAR